MFLWGFFYRPFAYQKKEEFKNHCKHGRALSTKRLLSYFKEIRVSAFGVSMLVVHPIPEKRQSATFPVCLPPPLLHASCALALSVQLLLTCACSSGRLSASGPDAFVSLRTFNTFQMMMAGFFFFLLPTARNDRNVYLNISHANYWHTAAEIRRAVTERVRCENDGDSGEMGQSFFAQLSKG